MRRKKRKLRRRIFIMLLLLFVLICGEKVGEEAYDLYQRMTWKQPKEWELLLVNDEHPMPERYTVNLVEAEEGKYVDERIYAALNEMFVDAREEGIYPVIRDAYRDREEQQRIMDEKVLAYQKEGYPGILAKRFAKDWVAEPGTSEHQLGLALDINADKEYCSNEDVYEWLYENAYRYGFILRYPKDKEAITNTAYEPWHYRYVGIDAALEMYEQNLCLEEYVD